MKRFKSVLVLIGIFIGGFVVIAITARLAYSLWIDLVVWHIIK